MRTLSLLCILILAITCNKIEKTTPIPNPIAQEEAIKFSLNLTNTSSNYILEVDSLIGNINITSKIPKDGISINLTLKRTDSNLIVWTKDTTVSSLNINFTIKNLNKELKYTLVSVVTSKTTATNSSTLSVDFQRIFPISQKRFNITIDISNVEGKTSIQSGEYQGGTELEIKAIPNDNYHFLGFEGYNEFENSIKIIVNRDITIKPIFLIKHNGKKKRNNYWFQESELDFLASENFIVWWDKKFNTLPQAIFLLKKFEEIYSTCKINGWDVPYSKKIANLNSNNHLMSLYLYNQSNNNDIIWNSGKARCCGVGGNELEGLPYSGWPINFIQKNKLTGKYSISIGSNSLMYHEGFHMMQFSMPRNTNGGDCFPYSGDYSWWTESTARWFERTYGIEGWSDWGEAYNSLCTQYLQPQVSLWRHLNVKDWSYGMNGYEKGELFRFLIQYKYVPQSFVFDMAYSKTTLSPQKYLFEKIKNFKNIYGEYASKFTSGIIYNNNEYDAAKKSIEYWLQNSCSQNINCDKSTNKAFNNQFVAIVGDLGTSDFVTPSEKNEAWSWTVIKINTLKNQKFQIIFTPDKIGNAGTLSEFRLYLTNREENLFKEIKYDDLIDISSNKDYFLVMVNTPNVFEGTEFFNYQIKLLPK